MPVEIKQDQHWQTLWQSMSSQVLQEPVKPLLRSSSPTTSPQSEQIIAPISGDNGRVIQVLLVLWILGSLWVLLLKARQFMQLWHIRQSAVLFNQHGPLSVFSSKQVEVPILCVIGQASIITPEAMRKWPKEWLLHVFEHELCHYRRKDHWFLLLSTLLSVVYWFHPMIHWLNRRLKQQVELACDQQLMVMGVDPISYAETLLACLNPTDNHHMVTIATQPSQISQR